MLANLEKTKIDYKNLYYRLGNRNREPSNFEKFGTMAELFQKIKFENIALEDVEPILIEFGHEFNSLKNTTARKQIYKDKKAGVLKSAESLLKGQKLIYSGFMDNIFSRGDEFSAPKEVTPKSDTSDFGISELLENEKETLRDMPELKSEESASQRRNQRRQGVKILTPQQMLSRLPTSSAQLKAGNNSEKLKNEIRQLMYSLIDQKS